jgi:NADH-quinone oxidoreductase subunit L
MEQSALAKLAVQSTWIGMGVSTAIALLIFCGAIGKSGQVPLHVWLPDAMEGPTPVSALIHAATMVAAGVFLVARVYPLMEAGPVSLAKPEIVAQASSLRVNEASPPRDPSPQESTNAAHGGKMPPEPAGETPALPSTALQVVTWIGAITALFAALVAVAQTGIKRILAYSTVSQLGFMFMGLGAGGVAVGMFHLLTHAFFKALLFLGAGSVIHGCHEEQDIRRMGGLRKFMPVTFATYAIGMMALSGVPLVFSGFWSKDEILHAAWLWEPSKWPFVFGVVGAFLTAFYMTRQMWFVFFAPGGSGRESAHSNSESHQEDQSRLASAAAEPHESSPIMTVPLGILAACAILLSVFGTPAWPWFHSYLTGHGNPEPSGTVPVGTLVTMFASAVISLGGIALGWRFYSRRHPATPNDPDPLEAIQPVAYGWMRGKFYFDELYAMSVVHWNAWCARASRWLDEMIWDKAVAAVSLIVIVFSWLARLIDEFVVNLGFDQGCGGLRRGAKWVSLWQNGQVQRYLRVIGVALTVGALVFIWGCGR